MAWYVQTGWPGVGCSLYSVSFNWPLTFTTEGQFFYTLAAMPNTAAQVGQLFWVIFVIVLVAVLAYYTTRLVASAKYGRGAKRNLELVESMSVGPQSFVHIVRMGGAYAAIGVTRGQVTLLTELDADRLELPQVKERPSFEAMLGKLKRPEQPGRDRQQQKEDS